MCFSASASFSAGVVLTAIGVASIKKAEHRSQYAFASIPLIFAVQQISEGFLWLSLTNPEYASLQQGMTYVFIFFAQVVWPIWVPYSILKIVKKEKRNIISVLLVVIGSIVSAYLAYCLIAYDIESKVEGYHIAYKQDYPKELSKYSGVLYMFATILPSFFTRIKGMWLLGTAIFISYLMTVIFYEDYIVSVWCFFASIISITIFALMYQVNRKKL